MFRLLADGSLDTAFVGTTDQLWFASGVAAYPDGRALVTAWQSGYPGVLRFAANVALAIPLVVDAAIEETEAFRVILDDPGGGVVLGESQESQVFIQNDDYGAKMRFYRLLGPLP